MSRHVSRASLTAACVCLIAANVRAGEQTARAILDATGVRGGLVVHVGCGDGRLTAALRANPSYLVHGLALERADVARARDHVRSAGLYGPVSIDVWSGGRLPYADNLVNLLVVDGAAKPAEAEMRRVLAPDGVAYVNRRGAWTKTVKARPKDIDEWTHYLHDAAGNPVAHDTVVGPPRRVQWVGGPRWSRHHDHMASMSALVSAGGRIFYIMDEGPTASIQLPPQWSLVARDAFSGVVLWKRPIEQWNTHRWPLKSGPAQLPRRLVAVGRTVYATLGLEAPVTALDAATGKTLRTYEGTANTEEILVSDGVLFAMADTEPSKWPTYRQQHAYVWANTRRANKDWAWNEQKRVIQAMDARTGKTLWRHEAPVAPLSLAVDAKRVCFHDGEKVVCLDRASARELWRSEPLGRRSPIQTGYGPRLILTRDVVLFSGGKRTMAALAIDTGKTLWTAKHPASGHMSPEDLIVIDGLVWSGAIAGSKDSGVFRGLDLLTGKVKSEFAPDVKIYWFHHRCHISKATDRFLLPSRTGIEFVDFREKHWSTNHWVRGGCLYGIMPCNGLVYAPPHSCGCYLEAKLNGFNALAPAAKSPTPEAPAAERLQRGPAFGAVQAGRTDGAGDWPTYRHDAARSGSTKTAVPTDLKRLWRTPLGGRLSSVVIAHGRLLVASVDTHTVHALDAATGKAVWTYTAGARVDSPPTVHAGRVVFGSADGWVYCLRAADGVLAWRFRAAPADRRVTAYGQLESAWPAHGSVLVQHAPKSGKPVVACAAGRSMFLDGGLRLCRLDLATGRLLSETTLDEKDPTTGENLQSHVKGLNMPVSLPDILSSDGQRLFMRSQQFDLQGKRLHVAQFDVNEQAGPGAHLFCQIGFLDDSWFHRSYWLYGRAMAGGYGGWFRAARLVPAGRLLVFDDALVYGYGRKPEYLCNASVLEHHLFAAARQADPEAIQRVSRAGRRMNARSRQRNADSSDWKLRRAFTLADLCAPEFAWRADQPSVQARAMVLAGKTLFVAGPPDVIDERRSFRLPDDDQVRAKLQQQRDALEGRLGARLWAVSAADGKPVVRYRLDALPVFDGMAAANGRLYMATAKGEVLCLGAGAGDALPGVGDEPARTASPEPAEPDYLEPPAVSKADDFDHVDGCAVLASRMKYRLRSERKNKVSVAVNKLPKPFTKRASFKVKLKAVVASGYLKNGLIVFGDRRKSRELVKCGVRIQAKQALIVQGPLRGGKTKGRKLDVEPAETIPVSVTVDLAKQQVTLTVKNVTVQAALERRLDAITHVGYGVDGALTDFSAIEMDGQ